MARTKRSLSANRLDTTQIASSQQVLYKTVWKPHGNGGKLRHYEEEEKGSNLLRLVTEEEVKPATKYYIKDPIKPNHFYETFFDPAVSWDSILEFIHTKQIYTRNETLNQDRVSEPPTNRDEGLVQSSLF